MSVIGEKVAAAGWAAGIVAIVGLAVIGVLTLAWLVGTSMP